jgi:hypothetical protein
MAPCRICQGTHPHPHAAQNPDSTPLLQIPTSSVSSSASLPSPPTQAPRSPHLQRSQATGVALHALAANGAQWYSNTAFALMGAQVGAAFLPAGASAARQLLVVFALFAAGEARPSLQDRLPLECCEGRTPMNCCMRLPNSKLVA